MKKVIFTRLVIENSPLFCAVFNIFARKTKKSMGKWLPFDYSGYKEAKNNKLVTFKKYNYEEVNDDSDGSHDSHRSKCTALQRR